jgi:hypothetical protein
LPFGNWPPSGVGPTPTRLTVFAALVGLNGMSPDVHGWGVITSGGPLGRCGLEQSEALTLIALNGVLGGVEIIDPAGALAGVTRIKDEIVRLAGVAMRDDARKDGAG